MPRDYLLFSAGLLVTGPTMDGISPCAGSMIRMADGTDKPVEELRKGDWLDSFGGEFSQPNELLESLVQERAVTVVW